MRTLLWALMGAILGVVGGWQLRDLVKAPVRPLEGYYFCDEFSNPVLSFISAKGTWRGADLANKINLVHVICAAASSECEMIQGDIVDLGHGPLLGLYRKTFKITQANDSSIVAVDLLPELCIRQSLLIDRTARSISFVRTKINREEACSAVQDDPVTMSLVDGRH